MSSQRNTNLSDVLFKVEQRPVFIQKSLKSPTSGRQAMLFPDESSETEKTPPQYAKIDKLQAVVDIEKNHVFSVVSRDYRLISNEEAIELGKKCFELVFSGFASQGMTLFNITTPKTRSFCHIDYIHQTAGFTPWDKDRWVPFLRITNSYNRTKPLCFDLGFCRWICTNGMIFGKKSITFRYLHTYGEIGENIEFKTSFGELKSLGEQFVSKLTTLKGYQVQAALMLPLLCRVFSIRASEEDFSRPKRRKQLLDFGNHVSGLTKQYFNEFGDNGYAALNVITDFASRPLLYISPAAAVDQLQKRSGAWVDEFIKIHENQSLDLEKYLADYLSTAQVIRDVIQAEANV